MAETTATSQPNITRVPSTIVKISNNKTNLQIIVVKIEVDEVLKRPYVRLTIGQQVYQTSYGKNNKSVWNEGFEFKVTHHERLFGVCQVDLYDTHWLFPDQHIGRAEIRLMALETFPSAFTSYFELWERKFSGIEVNLPGLKPKIIGAVQLSISHDDNLMGHQIPRSRTMPQTDTSGHIIRDIMADDDTVKHIFIDNLKNELENVNCKSTLTRQESHSSTTDQSSASIFGSRYSDSSLIEEKKPSILGKIGNWTLSFETKHALKSISRIATAFGQGFEISSVDSLAGAAILGEFHSRLGTYDMTFLFPLNNV